MERDLQNARGSIMHANIIGSGIAGPMAAITLRENDISVDVWESRAERDLHSDGILGIKPETWVTLHNHYVNAEQYLLPGDPPGDIVWTDLHHALTDRATALGARFHYGQTFKGDPSDLTVRATGVGSAKDVTTSHYTGYVIVRGLAYQFSGVSWVGQTSQETDGKAWYLMAGDTREGTSITAFLPRENPTMRTTYTTERPAEFETLPLRWSRLLETVPQFQVAPMSDWDVPNRMITREGQTTVIRIGDSNGQMRPRTSMGANLAIAEASNVELLVLNSLRDELGLLQNRQDQHKRGIELGVA
jgi:hypothetical protein